MADLSTLQTQLAEAEAAYHKLMTGSERVIVQFGEMHVRYTPSNAGALAGYIASLKSQIVAAGGTVTGSRRRAFVVDL